MMYLMAGTSVSFTVIGIASLQPIVTRAGSEIYPDRLL